MANDLTSEGLAFKPAVQFDFNDGESTMTINGIEESNLKYFKKGVSEGFVYFDNKVKNGNWMLEV